MLQKHVCLLYAPLSLSLSLIYLKFFTVHTGMLSHVDHLKIRMIFMPLSMPFDKHQTIIWCKSLNNKLKQTLN